MRARVVPIGNSRGVRIPHSLLKLCHIQEEVDIHIKGNTILIRPLQRKPRAGWEDAFQTMRRRQEDRLLIDDKVE